MVRSPFDAPIAARNALPGPGLNASGNKKTEVARIVSVPSAGDGNQPTVWPDVADPGGD
ncbi:hypothetical protein MINT15_40610 [Saccharomonospora viridis]|uniref:Uncharacterized protein n=1 Tax=Saccharomonospora viridis TaxID=1852 RepID=A0A837D4S6_9PSEU|nr:hypothetical protein MINT15_40610 [Saccharomonospora viridis]